jgi:hypothetical protein
MKKTFMLLVLTVLSVVTLVACQTEAKLTKITFTGVADVTNIAYGSEFNVLTGVKAIGDDNKDYTDQITVQSVATISALGVLDTQSVGVAAVKYQVKVGNVTGEKWRYLTVLNPTAVEGEMLINGDFSGGTGGWTDPNVNYISDGAEMTISADNGTLKVEVVAGSNVWTPRFGQMNVPFEQNKTYQVSFKAKSSVEKTINLQVGELLTSDPWFTDFKPGQTEHRLITTEWATYSYKFTHKLDNKRGGILFELGKLGNDRINATIWFDDIEITESTPDADTLAPTFSGLVAERSVLIGASFNPLAGVTAFDVVDGDVTDDITYVIKDASQAVVTAVDTSVQGVFTIEYSVEDAVGNKATFTVTVSVLGMLFSDTNILKNGDFSAPINATTPEWTTWGQDWDVPAAYTSGIVDGQFQMNITNTGNAAGWSIQLVQKVDLVEGKTYRASFDVKSSVARDIDFVITQDGTYYEHFKQAGIQLTTEFQTFQFVFTVDKTTDNTKFEFDLGKTPNGVPSIITFDNIKLQEAVLDTLLVNTTFDALGWQGFSNDWEGSVASLSVVNGEFKYSLTKYTNGSAGYLLQLIYGTKLVLEPNTTYTFSFDAYASKDLTLNPFFTQGAAAGWNNIVTTGTVAITTTKATYTVTATTGENVALPFELKFEFGTQFAPFETGDEFIMWDNLSFKKAAGTELLVNGSAQEVLNWSYDNSGGATGNMQLVDGKAVVTVETLGAAYQPHMYQMLSGLKAGNYMLKVVVISSVSRDLRVNFVIPNWGYASILTGGSHDFAVVADTEKVVYVPFTVTNDITDPVKFEFDFGGLGGTLISLPGTFTISEILLYQVIA